MKDAEKVSVKVQATSEGYYGDRIIREGEKFQYEGNLNSKGKLPLWVKPLEEFPKKSKSKGDKNLDSVV